MASNLRRSKRTVGKRITELDKKVERLRKANTPTRVGENVISDNNLGADISANKITAGTIDASVVNVTNINATNIVAGVLAGIQIRGGTPAGGLYPFDVSSAGVVRAVSGTIGGFTLSSTTISALFSRVIDEITTDSGSLTLSTNGTITSNYTYIGVETFYTTVRINDYTGMGNGSVTVEGTASGTYSKYVYSSTGAYNASDVRLKSVLEVEVDALSTINSIDVVKFTFNSDETAKPHVGFIAQQIYEHVPNAVLVGGEDPDEKPWLVNKEVVVPYLTRAIQQLSAKVDDLQARVTELEG